MVGSRQDPFVKKLARGLGIVGYYGFARYLPVYPLWFGDRIRNFCCRGIFSRCGKSSRIKKGAYFGTGNGLTLGENSEVGIDSRIYGIGGGGELSIGDNVMMGPEVVIETVSHFTTLGQPMAQQGNYGTKVTIEDDVWIGLRVVILPGVTISKGAVLGACAVVTKDVAHHSVVGGVPAKTIRNRLNSSSPREEKRKDV